MLVTVATFSLPGEAHLVRAKLKSEGIESFLLDEHAVAMDVSHSQVLGGIKLQVREADVSHAAEILRQGLESKSDSHESYDDKFRRRIVRRQRFVLGVVIIVFLVTLAVMLLA